jgi:protein-disulfide isomerase
LRLLTLLALAASLILAGCGGAGSGNPQQASGQEGQSPQDAGASGRSKPDGGRASGDAGRLEHPSLGSADAPVVLTEYADYQ